MVAKIDLFKVCSRHGEIPPSEVRIEKNKRYLKGYQLKCRFCDREKNKRQYKKKGFIQKDSWGQNKDFCRIHGALTTKQIVILKEERNKSGFSIACALCVDEDKAI